MKSASTAAKATAAKRSAKPAKAAARATDQLAKSGTGKTSSELPL